MLTDVKARNAKGRDKQYKIQDAHGLYLLVSPTDKKYWRFNYRFEGKRKTLALGKYPEISLSDARRRLLDARENIAKNIDPGEKKKAEKQVQTEIKNNFEVIAREWYAKYQPTWAASHSTVIRARLERDVFPYLGQEPVDKIKAPDILRLLRQVESRGALESARRIKIIIGQILRYAVATGRADRDAAADLKGALPPAKEKHFAAITEPVKFGALLRAIDGYNGSFVVKSALQLQALLFVRPGELRHAEWEEIDLDAAQWNLPEHKMKLKMPHIVPLSNQAVEILKQLHLLTKSSKFVFPSHRTDSRPMSENAMLAALRTMGYSKEEMTSHGFRAAARTMLDEVLQQRVDLIECQLAHQVKDTNRRSYNRTTFLAQRRAMMQLWSDYCDSLKAGAKLIPIVKAQ